MRPMPRASLWGMVVLVVTLMACAGSRPVSFSVTRPPLLSDAPVKVIACLGFHGEDVESGARVEARLTRQLAVSGPYLVIPPAVVLSVLSQHPHERGNVSDSLALIVGRAVHADAVLLGQVMSLFTEQYEEEKKFRVVEIATMETLTRRGSSQLKVEPYWEPFILQTASLVVTMRGLSVATGQELGTERVEYANILKIPLPAAVEDAPKKATVVKHIDPQLVEVVATGLVQRLVEAFSWHAVSFTRYVKRGVSGGDAGLGAALKGEWDQALATWERAVREAPNNPGAWNNVAIAYEQAGRTVEARQAYARALALQPGDSVIKKNQAGGW